MKHAILVHGWNSDPLGGWKPWLKIELEKNGFEVAVPQMPSPATPKMDKWVMKLDQTAKSMVYKSKNMEEQSNSDSSIPNSSFFLVGHSLGCITILRYLESLPANVSIGGVILVAGFADGLGMFLFDSFFSKPLDWEKIRSHCDNFVAIHSDNDRYVPLKHGKIFEEKLAAKLIVKNGAGHFSGGEGCTKLPVVLEELILISNRAF
jgi:uncharacterized protein